MKPYSENKMKKRKIPHPHPNFLPRLIRHLADGEASKEKEISRIWEVL